MYGTNARKALAAALTEAPEMKLGRFPDTRGKEGPIKDALARQLADRVLLELWHRGFAVSARTPKDRSPTGDRDAPELHARWRDAKRLGGRTPPAV